MKFLGNPWIVGSITAITTSAIGYCINQLPDIPNKEQNTRWIIAAVMFLTLFAAILSATQGQSAGSKVSSRVTGNRLMGKRNQLIVNREAEIRNNLLKGEDNRLAVKNESEAKCEEEP